jgi:hypothetical protein
MSFTLQRIFGFGFEKCLATEFFEETFPDGVFNDLTLWVLGSYDHLLIFDGAVRIIPSIYSEMEKERRSREDEKIEEEFRIISSSATL